MLRRWLTQWLVIAFAVGLTAALLPGINIDGGIGTVLWIAVIFGVVNAIIGTILRLLAIPLIVLTLGLVLLVINGLLLEITAALSDSLSIDNFGWAMLGALFISLIAAITELVLPGPRDRERAR